MRHATSFLHRIVRLMAAVAFVCLWSSAVAQPRYGMSPEVEAVFNRWVLATCVGDEERKLVEDLRRFAAPLAVAFRKAIVDGPPPAQMRVARVAADARFHRARRALPTRTIASRASARRSWPPSVAFRARPMSTIRCGGSPLDIAPMPWRGLALSAEPARARY